ncbi:MAG: demethylmenaquinone methyltransferase [Candidatus Hydrogenedentota bacterium]
MFDRIAHRYDLLNRMLSMRQDVAWRNRLARCLNDTPGQRVLDLATGTGDVLLTLCRRNSNVSSGVGVDMSGRMLGYGHEKAAAAGLGSRLRFVRGDATRIPVPEGFFDAVTISFGIRNVIDVPTALREMRRVLKPGGRVLILEFSLPGNPLFRSLYLWYFRKVLPRIGGVISGDHHAYRYLNQTVETFPYGDAFCQLMEDAGFRDLKAIPLTFGIATIYQGDKQA